MTTSLTSFLRSHRAAESAKPTHVGMDFMMGRYHIDDLSKLWNVYAKHTDPTCLLELSSGPDAHSPIRVDIVLTTEERQTADVIKTVRIYQRILTEIVPEIKGRALTCLLLDKPTARGKNGFHLHFPYAALRNSDQSRVLTPMVRERVKRAGLFFKCKYEVDDIAMKPWLVYGSAKDRDAEPYRVTQVFSHKGTEVGMSSVTRSKDPHKRAFPVLLWFRSSAATAFEVDPKFLEPPKPKRAYVSRPETEDLHDVVRELLDKLSSERCEQYSDWISVGKSIYGATDGDGFGLWDEWSQAGHSYRSYDMDQKWRSFSGTQATIGTLRWMARQDSGVSERARSPKRPPARHVRLLLRSAV